MTNIVNKIKEIPNLYHVVGCSVRQIEEAEAELGLKFPEEFIDYVKEFGAISFYGTELMGLNVAEYLSVVENTKKERTMNPCFPSHCFVLENQGIDGAISVMDEKGKVFMIQYDKKVLLCNSFYDYLDICIERKKE